MTGPGSAAGDRLDAIAQLDMAAFRENAGRHEYDGLVPDLSPDGVRRWLGRLGGPPLDDEHDERHLRTVEEGLRVRFGTVELHRRSPRPIIDALDLSGYDRPYAPVEERRDARHQHLRAWPDAIAAALRSLDGVPAAVAEGLLPSARGVIDGVVSDEPGAPEAVAAHRRLVDHLEHLATAGGADPALGAAAVTALLGTPEATDVDLGGLEEEADGERLRLLDLLTSACGHLAPGRSLRQAVDELIADHPDAEGVLDAAEELTAEVLDFTRERGLLEDLTGDCRVAPSPASRRWATAMMSWAAPYEADGPSWFFITPPHPEWPTDRQRQWLSAFSRTTLPATTAHEVCPGHHAHGRALRGVAGDVRRSLHSPAFTEGWAHYGEELLTEEGFRDDDARFVAGVALKALLRVTRLAVAVGLHRRSMTMEEATVRFREDAFVRDAVAEAEAARATFDPTYGRYTWGKLRILRLRDRARATWGSAFTLRRFHGALLSLGAPPLGLMEAALDS